MNLDVQNWQSFYLHRLFDIRMGNKFDKNKLDEDMSEVNLVSRVSYNNGVDVRVGYVEGVTPFPAGYVTVALGGSYLGSCFVQEEPFYTAQNVAVMKPRISDLSCAVCMFISGLVRYEAKTKYYAFGRELNAHIKTDFDVKLPIQCNADGSPIIDTSCRWSDDGYIPDWSLMEDYIKSLHHKPLTTKNKVGQVPKLKVMEWKEFRVGDLFDLVRGHTLTVENKDDYAGEVPCINGTTDNNGVQCYLSDEIQEIGFKKFEAPTITIVRVGEGGKTFVQMEDFYVADNAFVLISKMCLNKYQLLFISPLLDLECIKYSYGRTVTSDYVNTILKLPVDVFGNPDWQFMENYIKALPYGDRLEG